MESLVLRLVLPPLTVLAAGWLQHRVGPRVSGRLVGLPLTSGPLVLVLLLAEGAPAASIAAQGVLAGQLMVVGFTCAYAVASTRATARATLAAAAAATMVLGAGVHTATEALAWSGLAVIPVALMAIWLWRPDATPVASPTRPSGAQLGLRAGLAGVLVAGLSTSSRVLGAGLTGLLASVPLVVAVVAPSTHRDGGLARRSVDVAGHTHSRAWHSDLCGRSGTHPRPARRTSSLPHRRCLHGAGQWWRQPVGRQASLTPHQDKPQRPLMPAGSGGHSGPELCSSESRRVRYREKVSDDITDGIGRILGEFGVQEDDVASCQTTFNGRSHDVEVSARREHQEAEEPGSKSATVSSRKCWSIPVPRRR